MSNHKIAHTWRILEDIEYIEGIFPEKWVRGLKSWYLKIAKKQSTSWAEKWSKKVIHSLFQILHFLGKNPLCAVQDYDFGHFEPYIMDFW